MRQLKREGRTDPKTKDVPARNTPEHALPPPCHGSIAFTNLNTVLSWCPNRHPSSSSCHLPPRCAIRASIEYERCNACFALRPCLPTFRRVASLAAE